MKKEAIGFCKNWNQEKGFGFIQLLEGVDTGKTVFLHYSKMYSYYNKRLQKDEMVLIAYEQGEKGLQAVDCWSNVYGYIRGKDFRSLEETICDVKFDYSELSIPNNMLYHYSHIKTIEEYKEQVNNVSAVKANIKTILEYNETRKDGWFSGKEYIRTYEILEDEPKELHYKYNKAIKFIMRDFQNGKYIYRVDNYGDFNIEQYWKERKSTPSVKESSGDGTGLFPQWEADGFDE